MNTQTDFEELLAQGIAAASAGDEEEALRLLRRVTELEPENVTAWVWRARVTENNADKKAYLEQALVLDPANREARLALQRVIEKEGELAARIGEDEVLYCAFHPDRETMLRCNRCGRPMCTDCSRRHPVGLRCKECVSATKSPIYKLDARTIVMAIAASVFVGGLAGAVVILFGGIIGWFFWLFIGAAIGRAIAEGVTRLIPRKRGREMSITVGVGLVLGLLVAATGLALVSGYPIPQGIIALLTQLHVILYLATAVTTAVASLR